MGADKTAVVMNTLLLLILEKIAMLHIGKSINVLEYFRCMGIVQNTTTNAILLISTMVYRK